MAKGLVEQSTMTSIADAIRAKGVEGSWKPAEMPAAIASITTGGGGSSDFGSYSVDTTPEDIYQDMKKTAGLPPLLDAKEAWDMIESGELTPQSPNRTMSAVVTQLLIKQATSGTYHYSYAYGQSIFGNYDDDGKFVPYATSGYGTTATNVTSALEWKKWGEYEYTIAIFINDDKYFLPYISGTSYSYSNGHVVDVDIYYNDTMADNYKYYNRRYDLVYPNMVFFRIQKGPKGSFTKDVSYDDGAIYYNSNGKLRVVRDLDINVKSSGNGIMFSSKLIAFKGYHTTGSDTVYGLGCFPVAVFYEVGPVSLRSSNYLPTSSSVPQGCKTFKLHMINQSPSYISMPSTGVYTEVYLGEGVITANAGAAVNQVCSLEQLIGLGKSLPDYDSNRFASKIISINTSTAVPVSAYPDVIKVLTDKGWTVSGGR